MSFDNMDIYTNNLYLCMAVGKVAGTAEAVPT